MLILAATLPFVAGCGVYLHSPALETSTAAVKTSFGALSAPAYLEQQQTQLADFAGREDRAVAELYVASRDYSLINIVAAETDRGHRAALLQLQVRGLLTRAAGMGAFSDPGAVVRRGFERSTNAREAQTVAVNLDRLRAEYRRLHGTSDQLSCAQILQGTGDPPAADTGPARTWYQGLAEECRTQADATDALTDCAGGLGGRLGAACVELAGLQDRQRLSVPQRAQFTLAVNALKEVIDRTSPDPESQRLRNLVDQIRATPTLADYREVLAALDSVFRTRLSTALDDVAQARDRALSHPVIDSTLNALHALELIGDLSAEQRSALDEPSALLIGLAKARHDLNLVEVAIDSVRRQVVVKQAEIDALRIQILYLARVQTELCGGRSHCVPAARALADALSYYVSSYDRGLAPAEILRSRGFQLRRAAAVREAQTTEADYRALLQPAIEQLAAYGAGGVRPEVLGQFLANLPISAAILGR
jgi:hypothetical protein